MKDIEASIQHSEERGRLSDLLHPSLRAALVVGIGLADSSADYRHQHRDLLRATHHSIRGHFVGVRRHSGHGRHRRRQRPDDHRFHVADRPRWAAARCLLTGIAGMVVTLFALGYAFHAPMHGGSLATVAVICMMLYVASFAISLGPIFWLLISEIYPTEDSQFGRRPLRHLQLGIKSSRFADFPDTAANDGREPHILALRSIRHRRLDFFLLSGPGNQGPHSRGNRGILAKAPRRA